jgi:hypothetical protein
MKTAIRTGPRRLAIVPDHAASRAWAADMEARERAAIAAARPAIVRFGQWLIDKIRRKICYGA